MSDDLLKLAERCEAAIGPDRELDAEIAHLLQIFDPKQTFAIAPFTASLDAAMSLVPEGSGFGVHRLRGSASAFVDSCAVEAHTPALALCCAALRARSAA